MALTLVPETPNTTTVTSEESQNIVVPELAKPTVSKKNCIWDDFDTELNQQLRPQNQTAAGIKELDRYVEDEMQPRNENPLKWWEDRKRIYSILYSFMRKRLCVMATSVPCERVFSKAGHVLNERRTSLKDDKSLTNFIS